MQYLPHDNLLILFLKEDHQHVHLSAEYIFAPDGKNHLILLVVNPEIVLDSSVVLEPVQERVPDNTTLLQKDLLISLLEIQLTLTFKCPLHDIPNVIKP
jgi:hypothetical protein